MVRINKIGKNFGLKCELREYLLPLSRAPTAAAPWAGVPDGPLRPPWG